MCFPPYDGRFMLRFFLFFETTAFIWENKNRFI